MTLICNRDEQNTQGAKLVNPAAYLKTLQKNLNEIRPDHAYIRACTIMRKTFNITFFIEPTRK